MRSRGAPAVGVALAAGLVSCGAALCADDDSHRGATAAAFADVTAAAGLVYEHGYREPLVSEDGSFDERRHFAGGVAAGDYDGDGWVDLYAVRGDIGPNLLFRNRGDGTFEELAAAAGVAVGSGAGPPTAGPGEPARHIGSGPTFADVDGDGWLDLFVGGIRGAPAFLFRNRGDGTFADHTAASGLQALERASYSAAFGDYDRDGDLDLALAHWNSQLFFGESSQTLWRNDGELRFTDVSRASGVTAALLGELNFVFDFTFTPNFADLDGDAWPDLLLASDVGTSQVLRNRGDGSFEDRTERAVISDENGMGAAVGDYDNDGVLDWFVSSIWDPNGVAEGAWGTTGNRLYRGLGDGRFEDVTSASGLRHGYWGWGATWIDVNNDGLLDLFHVNGFGRSPDYEPSLEFFADPSRLFVAAGDGTFTERAAALGLVDHGMGRGVVSFDFDRDGRLDLFVANSGGSPRLYRNQGGGGHFLSLELRDRGPNSHGVGARVYATAAGVRQMRELRAGSNFESQDPIAAHFGLGAATSVERLEVHWLTGGVTVRENLAADQHLRLEREPSAEPTPTASPTPPPAACAGDCDANGRVTAAELVRGMGIAGGAPLSACPSFDDDGEGSVSAAEVRRAVAGVYDCG